MPTSPRYLPKPPSCTPPPFLAARFRVHVLLLLLTPTSSKGTRQGHKLFDAQREGRAREKKGALVWSGSPASDITAPASSIDFFPLLLLRTSRSKAQAYPVCSLPPPALCPPSLPCSTAPLARVTASPSSDITHLFFFLSSRANSLLPSLPLPCPLPAKKPLLCGCCSIDIFPFNSSPPHQSMTLPEL